MAASMYESPHPPHVAKASDASAQLLGIDWSSIDGTVWLALIATVAIVALLMLKGRNRRRLGRARATGNVSTDVTSAAVLLNDISWGPGHHSHSGSDASHHGGFFDGGGTDAGGGHM
jgi:hypothetical protein